MDTELLTYGHKILSWLPSSLHLRPQGAIQVPALLQQALIHRNRRRQVHTYVIAIRRLPAAYMLSLL